MSGPVALPPETGRRRLAARGTLINAAFQISAGALTLLKSLIAAAFLTAADYGVWGIVLLAVAFGGVMKTAAVGDKYIQQDDPDEHLAFQKAFTLELIFSVFMFALICAAAPLLALAYGRWDLVAPCLVLALVLPATVLLAPNWIFYRRMDFLRQRVILLADPVIAFAVTVALAAGGAGYWSLVIGLVAGSVAAGALALVMSPIGLALRYEGGTMKEYFHFSWPLVVAAGGAILLAQVSLLLGDLSLGLAGTGAIALASTLAFYTDSIDRIVTQTIYPAVCRVRERKGLLLETFVKSNRLTLMWGMPFGVGLALFASDLVNFGLGSEWTSAIVLIQVWGLTAAFNHIGFNWDAFYRAFGRTRPIAVVSLVSFATLLITAGPLLFVIGLDGYAVGLVTMTSVALGLRWHYLRRVFPELSLLRYTLRAVLPTAPASAAVLGVRLLESGPRSLSIAVAELALYIGVTAALTLVFERSLLREMLGYLRQRNTTRTAVPLKSGTAQVG